MGAYYNENEPKAAAWLRELIKQGHIAPGEVDERSIVDVAPNDLQGFQQVHWFAGIGVWSHALRLAGWPDNRRVWTGSCPCQPFSAAGKGAGTSDERHLWPYWEHLIRECGPPVIFGEQVASKAADSWADLVQDDLEALGYAFGAVPFPAAGVGAPHIRDRLYWMAHHQGAGRGQERTDVGGELGGDRAQGLPAGLEPGRGDSELANSKLSPPQRQRRDGGAKLLVETSDGSGRPGCAASWWGDAAYVWCLDQKYRPVEPGTFPLAHGAPARVGRLRGYGNAIVSEAAKVFIEASGLV